MALKRFRLPLEPDEAQAEDLRELAKHPVAGVVAEVVVDLLQPVGIDEQHGRRRRRPLRDLELVRGDLEERSAVRQLGEVIDQRELAQLRFLFRETSRRLREDEPESRELVVAAGWIEERLAPLEPARVLLD